MLNKNVSKIPSWLDKFISNAKITETSNLGDDEDERLGFNGFNRYINNDQMKANRYYWTHRVSVDQWKYFANWCRGGFISRNPDIKRGDILIGHFYGIDIHSAYPFYGSGEMPYGEILKDKPIDPSYTFLKIKIIKAKKKFNQYPNFIYTNNLITDNHYSNKIENLTVYYIQEEWDFILSKYDIDFDLEDMFFIKKKVYLKEGCEQSYRDRGVSKNAKAWSTSMIGYCHKRIFDRKTDKLQKIGRNQKKLHNGIYCPVFAIITALVRIRIMKHVCMIIDLGYKWMMSITDSIYFSDPKHLGFPSSIIKSKDFGSWDTAFKTDCNSENHPKAFMCVNLMMYIFADSLDSIDNKKWKVTAGSIDRGLIESWLYDELGRKYPTDFQVEARVEQLKKALETMSINDLRNNLDINKIINTVFLYYSYKNDKGDFII